MTPALLVAFSVAICLGAAVTSPVTPLGLAGEGPGSTLRTHDREALASLLSCFTDAARRLHPTEQGPAIVPASPGFHAWLSLDPARHVHAPLADELPLVEPLQVHLLNLPPPLA